MQLVICWFGGNVTLHDEAITNEKVAMHTLLSRSVLFFMLVVFVCGEQKTSQGECYE